MTKCENSNEVITYLEEVFRIKNVLEYIKKSKENFPFDYRYVILKEDDLNEKLKKIILDSYTDEELDLVYSTLLSYVYETSFEAIIFEEDDIFNKKNHNKVLEKCCWEYNKRF